MKQLLIFALVIIIPFQQVIAQTVVQAEPQQTNYSNSGILALSWEIAFPTGSNRYLSKTSFAGFRVDYQKFVKDNFSIGFATSWNSFDEYVGTRTYRSEGGSMAVTTDMVKQIYTVPVTATFHYYMASDKMSMLKPYVAVGLGGEYAEQYAYFNIYEVSGNNWGFVVRPELGALARFSPYFSALLSIHYQWATNQNSDLKVNDIAQFGINIGGAWNF